MFVASLNQHRRHLDAGQKAMVALKLEEELAKEAKRRQVQSGGNHGNQHTGGKLPVVQIFEQPADNKSDIITLDRGTSSSYALEVLQNKRPDLHARVLSGKLSPHAAMLEAKFRRPTMTVTLDNPRSAASLIAKASPEFLEELKRLLS